ncbi:MAG: hypothetical protein ACR2IB_04070 [Pyrinomonadaceae bacterium]
MAKSTTQLAPKGAAEGSQGQALGAPPLDHVPGHDRALKGRPEISVNLIYRHAKSTTQLAPEARQKVAAKSQRGILAGVLVRGKRLARRPWITFLDTTAP